MTNKKSQESKESRDKPVYVLGPEAHGLAEQLQAYRKAQRSLKELEEEVKGALGKLVNPVLADLGYGPLQKTVTFAIQDSSLLLRVIPGSTTVTNRKRVLELAGPEILSAATSKTNWTRLDVVDVKGDSNE